MQVMAIMAMQLSHVIGIMIGCSMTLLKLIVLVFTIVFK